MKLLSFTILTLCSVSSYAIDFHSCTDNKGQIHYSNLPKSSIGSTCAPKDQYSAMLNQDYQNLSNEHAKYEELDKTDNNSPDESDPFEISKVDISPNAVKNKVKDIFNPDKALEELMEATEDRDDVFTRAMRGRSNGIEKVLKQGNSGTP